MVWYSELFFFFFFFQAEDGIRDDLVTGVQTCSLPRRTGSGRTICSTFSPRPRRTVPAADGAPARHLKHVFTSSKIAATLLQAAVTFGLAVLLLVLVTSTWAWLYWHEVITGWTALALTPGRRGCSAPAALAAEV